MNWISVEDKLPESLLNVLVKIDAKNVKNEAYMVAHFTPRYTEEYNGWEDWDEVEYHEEKDAFFCPEGWYANTTYIGDDYSSYLLTEKVTHWIPLPEPPK